jgi:hypothetical protein
MACLLGSRRDTTALKGKLYVFEYLFNVHSLYIWIGVPYYMSGMLSNVTVARMYALV